MPYAVMVRSLLVLLGLAAIASTLSARPFTNTEGKTIEAEIVRATPTTVTLRLENQRTATIKIEKLIDEHQEIVRQWLADMVPRLRITPKMVKSTNITQSAVGKKGLWTTTVAAAVFIL